MYRDGVNMATKGNFVVGGVIIFKTDKSVKRCFIGCFLRRCINSRCRIVTAKAHRARCFRRFRIPCCEISVAGGRRFSGLPGSICTIISLTNTVPTEVGNCGPCGCVSIGVVNGLGVLRCYEMGGTGEVLFTRDFKSVGSCNRRGPLLAISLPHEFDFADSRAVCIVSGGFTISVVRGCRRVCKLGEFVFHLPAVCLCSPISAFCISKIREGVKCHLLVSGTETNRPVRI